MNLFLKISCLACMIGTYDVFSYASMSSLAETPSIPSKMSMLPLQTYDTPLPVTNGDSSHDSDAELTIDFDRIKLLYGRTYDNTSFTGLMREKAITDLYIDSVGGFSGGFLGIYDYNRASVATMVALARQEPIVYSHITGYFDQGDEIQLVIDEVYSKIFTNIEQLFERLKAYYRMKYPKPVE